MSVPKYNELYRPFLTAIQDGQVHTIKEVKMAVSHNMGLSEEDLTERISSGQTVFSNRIGWAKTYLKKAGLIQSPMKGKYVITPEGQKLLHGSEDITNELLAMRYPEFAAFIGYRYTSVLHTETNAMNAVTDAEENAAEVKETPLETLERAHMRIDEQLADDLLTEIMNQTPAFFEKLVVDLLKGMGYGDGFVTKYSGDAGVDGIIHEDKLGFNLIYIQAKRWAPENKIQRQEIQKFAGAMMGPPRVDNGLFITTAGFTEKAKEYADAQHIILVDGHRLCELMIEYGVGVTTVKTYAIKKVDGDYFSEE